MCHLRVWPSKINSIEVIKDPSPGRRLLLGRAIAEWCGSSALLPWPPQILQLAGHAALRGENNCEIPKEMQQVLVPTEEDSREDQNRAQLWVRESEDAFDRAHGEVRQELQDILKEKGLHGQWPTAAAFLDEEWSKPENQQHFTQLFWTHFDLPGEPPANLFALSEAWRIFMDAFGASVYDRAVAKEQKRNPPGVMDLLQVVYLSMHTAARILVTNDKGLATTATAILSGRYPNVRVMDAESFLGRSPA